MIAVVQPTDSANVEALPANHLHSQEAIGCGECAAGFPLGPLRARRE
jgi:hypothetical protein